ncbi:DUF2764 family protein [Rhodopirellula sp. JC639]|uniref:DUF2764 family protein n=1 Tax=Stieleria mannarensis TaxID=2755585 RepID=UPI0015FFA778|nr:DUF2764 family protein [Rhodopirellula sp. JC639]
MYYDLITSLPYLQHFERADRLPITPLRLEQRLRRLRPKHADQLNRARQIVRWRPERLTGQSDRETIESFSQLLESELNEPLRDYVQFRLTQLTLLAALRRKHDGRGFPDDPNAFGNSRLAYTIRRNWELPFFGLKYCYPWLPPATEKLSAGDAIGLERLMMDLHWQWLTRRSELSMFEIDAVVAFVLKWDMLRAWINGDPVKAKVRFTQLIDKVTDVQNT